MSHPMGLIVPWGGTTSLKALNLKRVAAKPNEGFHRGKRLPQGQKGQLKASTGYPEGSYRATESLPIPKTVISASCLHCRNLPTLCKLL